MSGTDCSTNEPMSDSQVVISLLARAPQFGTVKSRLARHVGPAQALRTHIALLTHNLLVAHSTGLPVELVVAGDTEHPWLVSLSERVRVPLLTQSDGDIGQRMLACAARVTATGRASLIIGSDCAAMSGDYLQRAASRLQDSVPMVFGPAEDGGYVLVGQNRAVPQAFADISWGTQHVMQQTRAALRQAAIEFDELETLWDVDTVADERRLRCSLRRRATQFGKIFVPS